MGNRVLQGTPFEQVAKEDSQGVTAAEGGVFKDTTQGSLAAEEVDKAIFALPPNRPSRILESERGYHIVRVLQRKDGYRTPFREAQVEIKEKILNERREKALAAFEARLKRDVPTWTIFDDLPTQDEPSEQIGSRPAPAPQDRFAR